MEENFDQVQTPRRLEISNDNKMLMGVCGSFGRFISFEPAIVRILVLLLFFILGQAILFIYSAFGLILPLKESSEQNFSKQNRSITITLNILLIAVIIFLILIQQDVITINETFNFLINKFDPFTLFIFSLVLIINNYEKGVKVEMQKKNIKKLTLSDNKVIFGVCGGLAEYFNIHPNIMRIIWLIFLFASFGTALIVYIILKFIIPPKKLMSDLDE